MNAVCVGSAFASFAGVNEYNRLDIITVDSARDWLMNVLALLKGHPRDERLIQRLTMAGYQLFLADDVRQALDILGEHQVHSVVFDVDVADQDFLARLRQVDGTEYVYVFALTTNQSLSPAKQEYLGYVDEYLARPFEPDELIARLMVMERYLQTLVALRSDVKPRQPIRDPLTGMFSQTAILELLETEMERSRRSGRPFSLALFKLENVDAFRRAGDPELLAKALTQFALKVWASVRAYDLIGCWGEDQFLLILPETSASAAAVVMTRVRRNVQSVPVQLGEGESLALQVVDALVQSDPFDGGSSRALLAAVEKALLRSQGAESA